MEPILRDHPDERSLPLERPLDNVNLNINVLISTPGESPALLKGHITAIKRGGLTRGVSLEYLCVPVLDHHWKEEHHHQF